MIYFTSDYTTGAHPEKLKKLSEYIDTAFWKKYDDDPDELERVLKEVF